MPKENDLEGPQDMGGKHGGQKGNPKPEPHPSQKSDKAGDVVKKKGNNRAKHQIASSAMVQLQPCAIRLAAASEQVSSRQHQPAFTGTI
jgi:hypothetical protein